MVVLFVLPVLVLLAASSSAEDERRAYGARVLVVHDGDTITLQYQRRDVRTRLLGIDAPEMGQRPWGRAAKDHLIAIMIKIEWYVYVETDAVNQDKYGRMLAYLWTGRGELINERMLLDGQAMTFIIKPNARYAKRFKEAEHLARKGKKGIWQDHGLKQSPFEYRETHPRSGNRILTDNRYTFHAF